MSRTLIVGAARGLGSSLVKQYAAKTKEPGIVYGTTRSTVPDGFPSTIKWLKNIDLTDSAVGDTLAKALQDSKPLTTVVSTLPSR